MTEIREIALHFPADDAHCNLIADQLVAAGFHELARQLRIAVNVERPKVVEPTEFGSIVRAGYDEHSDRVLWQRGPKGGWFGEDGAYHAYFAGLHDPEVLRVGVGPQPLAEWESNLLNEQEVRDVAAAVLGAMDVDQYLIDAVVNARPR